MCQIYNYYGEITSAGALKPATLKTTVAHDFYLEILLSFKL